MLTKKLNWLFGILLMVVLALPIIYWFWKKIEVPPYEPVEVVWTNQNWKQDDWQWWYHASQGSGLQIAIPYKWFISLEQPKLSFFKPAPEFIDPKFIGRFGFLPDGKNPYNPDGIPVGFTKTENYIDFASEDKKPETVVGLNCAACHTGQVNYQGKGIRIDGGPSMIEVEKFKIQLGMALGLTDFLPWRFNRFANKVLGENYNDRDRYQLKQKLHSLFTQGLQQSFLETRKKLYPIEEGFARLDALGRIGNFVFGSELNEENYRIANAPVNFPHLWSVPWFDWVQYNGSVSQPMARNAGQALGVFAGVELDTDSPEVFQSNVNVGNIFKIEKLLSGITENNYGKINRTNAFSIGLTAPAWPEHILGKIDLAQASKGKKLYQQFCQSCHLPPVDSEEFMADSYWTKMGTKNLEYLKVTMKNLYEIGTDPRTAENWNQRIVNIGSLASEYDNENKGYEYNGIVSAGYALSFIGRKTVQKKYDELQLTSEQRDALNGFRPDNPRSPLAYKARPLNGIWATAPFLHNGSVPNLYEMLLPVEQRSKKFYLGTKEFDPKYVGFKKDKITGGFLLDTTKTGNSNTGHEFKGNGIGPGVIGPEFSEEDRWALVEYLKTL